MSDSYSSDGEDWGGMSLFGDFGDSGAQSTPACSMEFWDRLRTVAVGKNQLGDIVLMGEFGADKQLLPPGENNGGLRYACARKFGTGAGYSITGSLEPCEGAVPVYWIPWKTGVTVYAERAWFENSKCEFMITSQLSGCRFVVTDKHVLHVASNAYGAADYAAGSGTRDVAERLVTKGASSRRLSISGPSGYKTYALAFGIRYEESWKYKALSNKVKSAVDSDWVSLMG